MCMFDLMTFLRKKYLKKIIIYVNNIIEKLFTQMI